MVDKGRQVNRWVGEQQSSLVRASMRLMTEGPHQFVIKFRSKFGEYLTASHRGLFEDIPRRGIRAFAGFHERPGLGFGK